LKTILSALSLQKLHITGDLLARTTIKDGQQFTAKDTIHAAFPVNILVLATTFKPMTFSHILNLIN
jgi:hypothetical protein